MNSWGGGGGGSNLEKEEGFQFQTSQGMNGKTGILRGKPPLVRCSKKPVMSVLISSYSCFIGGKREGTSQLLIPTQRVLSAFTYDQF